MFEFIGIAHVTHGWDLTTPVESQLSRTKMYRMVSSIVHRRRGRGRMILMSFHCGPAEFLCALPCRMPLISLLRRSHAIGVGNEQPAVRVAPSERHPRSHHGLLLAVSTRPGPGSMSWPSRVLTASSSDR